ncbi:hypothetical protein [Pelagibacterium montanilacus]|nr:hypothetical protein [Pelagibacterium montanilacus]
MTNTVTRYALVAIIAVFAALVWFGASDRDSIGPPVPVDQYRNL